MARTRSVHPSLLKRIKDLSDPAQALVWRLPVACDDAGRVRHDLELLAKALFPGKLLMEEQLPGILDELERHGWIERYTVDGTVYLRMVHWGRDQYVDNPTPSRLPPPPTEGAEDSINIESFGTLQGRERKGEGDQAVVAVGSNFIESPVFSGGRILESAESAAARKRALSSLLRIQGKAEKDDKHHAAIRAVVEQVKLSEPPMAVRRVLELVRKSGEDVAAAQGSSSEATRVAGMPDPVTGNAHLARG